jgi:hypothetical protein
MVSEETQETQLLWLASVRLMSVLAEWENFVENFWDDTPSAASTYQESFDAMRSAWIEGARDAVRDLSKLRTEERLQLETENYDLRS